MLILCNLNPSGGGHDQQHLQDRVQGDSNGQQREVSGKQGFEVLQVCQAVCLYV